MIEGSDGKLEYQSFKSANPVGWDTLLTMPAFYCAETYRSSAALVMRT